MKLHSFLNGLLDLLNRKIFPRASIATALSLVSRKEMYELNKNFRGRSKSTDILSFPSTLNYQELESLLTGQEAYPSKPSANKLFKLSKSFHGDELLLGHLVLCPEVIFHGMKIDFCKYSRNDFNTVQMSRLVRLIFHGYAHLFHFDHHERDEWIEMRKFENLLFKQIDGIIEG